MASKSLADLNAIVRFRGDYRNLVRFPDANINVEIQAAFAELYELIADTNEGYWDTTSTVDTAVEDDFVALPSEAWRVRGIDRFDGDDPVELMQVTIADRNRFGSRTGKPCAYRLTARGADIYPSADAVYVLRIVYTPFAPVLDDAREWYNGWEEYVVFGALIRLALNEERSAGEWQQQLDIQRARIVRGASGRKSAGPEYLTLYDGGFDFSDEVWR
jgi:hypothetical protein